MATGESTPPVQMRLDVAKQPLRQMQVQQIRQRWIGPVEIHSSRIRRQQSWFVGRAHAAISFKWLHTYLLFVPPDLDHLSITQVCTPSTSIIGGPPHGYRSAGGLSGGIARLDT